MDLPLILIRSKPTIYLVLIMEKIPCQEGEESPITSPKLDSLSFGLTIFDGIVALLPSTKEVCLYEGGLGCFCKGRLRFL